MFERMVSELAPGFCWLCGDSTDAPPACTAHRLCVDALSRCGRCAGPLPAGAKHGARCWRCRQRGPAFQSTVVAGTYTEPLSSWILAWKHRPRPALVEPLAGLASLAMARVGSWPARLFVPIPAHPLRRLERGHDGVGALAYALADRFEGEAVRGLCRTRATPPQGEPGARSRSANVADAFDLTGAGRKAITGQRVVLVDDVVTTGATTNEAARVLRRAGAARVDVVAIARAHSSQQCDSIRP